MLHDCCCLKFKLGLSNYLNPGINGWFPLHFQLFEKDMSTASRGTIIILGSCDSQKK